MAQGDPRPRHHRQPSRFSKLGHGGANSSEAKRERHSNSSTDKDTIEFIKHVLCSGKNGGPTSDAIQSKRDDTPLEELLPPLTSSNAVDVQLYAIIAVILSQFVQTWYHRITPDDAFVAEIVQIIAHCTRGLEQRLRHVDLVELLLDELPALAVTHLQCSCHAFVTRSSTNNVQLSRLHGVHPLATI
jgi:hypothetical protein